jgi:hypothetical protein
MRQTDDDVTQELDGTGLCRKPTLNSNPTARLIIEKRNLYCTLQVPRRGTMPKISYAIYINTKITVSKNLRTARRGPTTQLKGLK